jgi:hypothetical protein
MIKKCIIQNKHEKEVLLNDDYVIREKLADAMKEIDNAQIKVILGPRRSGKSVFGFLLLKDRSFAYVNFDDENLLKIDNYDLILESIFEVYGHVNYFFFDEIQNLHQWEFFVNKLKRRKYKIILSGSNANLLSQELASALTGRYSSFEIFPFNFSEFLLSINETISNDVMAIPEKKGLLLKKAEQYLIQGGYPEVVVDGLNPRNYLGTLFDAILFKDIVMRYQVRYPHMLNQLAQWFITNFTSQYTYSRLRKNLNFSSVLTVEKYVGYLENAYLFFSLRKFSVKLKEQIKTPRKIYLIDNGFVYARAFQLSNDEGRLLENCVFLELLRRGNSLNTNLFYYKTLNNKEIDFVVKNSEGIQALYQVSYSISDDITREREISALIVASKELHCSCLYVITWDTEEQMTYHSKYINIVPFWKWATQQT